MRRWLIYIYLFYYLHAGVANCRGKIKSLSLRSIFAGRLLISETERLIFWDCGDLLRRRRPID